MSTAPSATELVFLLGAGDRLVGVSRYDDTPAEIAALPRVGGFSDPNVEAIVALRPDLVLAAPNAQNKAALMRLGELNLSVVVLPGNRMADYFVAARALAKVLGGHAVTIAEERLVQDERKLAACVNESHAAQKWTGASPKVAIVYDRNPLVLGGRDSFAGTLVAMLGAINVANDDVEYPMISREELIVMAPDIVIDASMGNPSARQNGTHTLAALDLTSRDPAASFWAALSPLPAVQKSRVYVAAGSAAFRPGPRLVDLAQELLQLLRAHAALRRSMSSTRAAVH